MSGATERYPELRQLFGAYLGDDWTDEFGSVEAAIAAYRSGTSPEIVAAARRETARLRAAGSPAERLVTLQQLGAHIVLATDEIDPFLARIDSAL